MKTVHATVTLLLLAAALPAQRAVTDAKPPSFEEALAQAKATFDSGKFGACVKALQAAMNEAVAKRTAVLRDAMPAAPDGFTKKPPRDNKIPAGMGGALGGLAAMAAANVEVVYQGQDGANIKLTVIPNSPIAGMAAMMFNPMIAKNDPNAQLFEYDGGHKALAKVNGDRVKVDALLGGKHQISLDARKIELDVAMKMLSQDTMNKIAAALAE